MAPPVSKPDTSQRVKRVEDASLADSSSGRRRILSSASKTSDICFASSLVGAIMIAKVPIDRSIYERLLSGSRSWIMGMRKDNVLPDPVCDWMNVSLSAPEEESMAVRVARCIDVGFSMPILFDRCATNSGSTPSPAKEEESVKGALLGRARDLGVFGLSGISTVGL